MSRSLSAAMGGNETFAGYDFRYVPLRGRAKRAGSFEGGRAVAGWLGRQWPRSPHLPRPLRLGNVLDNLAQDAATAYFLDLCFVKPQAVQALLGSETELGEA
jgi:hypothetical protein